MTNEQAIEVINEHIKDSCIAYGTFTGQALRMAIEALKAQLPQERTDKRTETHACDLISRRQAIDAVKERYYKYGRFAKIEELVWSIEKLPSAQKKGHWIDEETNYRCSECHRGCWVNSDYCPWCGADMRGT